MSDLIKIQQEIEREVSNKKTLDALVATTFKGLSVESMKKAMFEGMARGFKFKDFLEKNVYAVPYGQSYSLVTSIDYARKVGMRSGVVGKLKPEFEEKDGKIISCTVTIKRKVNEYVGDFTATVYFDEYSTGRNLWSSKPRTMIAKVAEMHALRMACPEELSEMYTEEEFAQAEQKAKPAVDMKQYETKLREATTLEELGAAWASLPGEVKVELQKVKEELKEKYANSKVQ